MDLPMSGNLVAMAGSLCNLSSPLNKIYVQSSKDCKSACSSCAFCNNKIMPEEKIVNLHCKHSLHFSCVQKWVIITNPCKMCQ